MGRLHRDFLPNACFTVQCLGFTRHSYLVKGGLRVNCADQGAVAMG